MKGRRNMSIEKIDRDLDILDSTEPANILHILGTVLFLDIILINYIPWLVWTLSIVSISVIFYLIQKEFERARMHRRILLVRIRALEKNIDQSTEV